MRNTPNKIRHDMITFFHGIEYSLSYIKGISNDQQTIVICRVPAISRHGPYSEDRHKKE